MMLHYIAIGLGGALGAMSRAACARLIPATIFQIPIPIILINVLGCFCLGIVTELFTNFGSEHQFFKLFLTTGFLGGFTTFSTFSLEAGLLFTRHLYLLGLLYILLSVIMSLAAFFLGLRAVNLFF